MIWRTETNRPQSRCTEPSERYWASKEEMLKKNMEFEMTEYRRTVSRSISAHEDNNTYISEHNMKKRNIWVMQQLHVSKGEKCLQHPEFISWNQIQMNHNFIIWYTPAFRNQVIFLVTHDTYTPGYMGCFTKLHSEIIRWNISCHHDTPWTRVNISMTTRSWQSVESHINYCKKAIVNNMFTYVVNVVNKRCITVCVAANVRPLRYIHAYKRQVMVHIYTRNFSILSTSLQMVSDCSFEVYCIRINYKSTGMIRSVFKLSCRLQLIYNFLTHTGHHPWP